MAALHSWPSPDRPGCRGTQGPRAGQGTEERWGKEPREGGKRHQAPEGTDRLALGTVVGRAVACPSDQGTWLAGLGSPSAETRAAEGSLAAAEMRAGLDRADLGRLAGRLVGRVVWVEIGDMMEPAGCQGTSGILENPAVPESLGPAERQTVLVPRMDRGRLAASHLGETGGHSESQAGIGRPVGRKETIRDIVGRLAGQLVLACTLAGQGSPELEAGRKAVLAVG